MFILSIYKVDISFHPPNRTIAPPRVKLKHASAPLSAHGLALLLHNLADLHGRVEELGGTPVEADRLALVELALAVVVGDALLLARLLQAIAWVSTVRRSKQVDATYRLYVSAIMRISPSTAAIFCSDVGCWRPIPRKDILAVDSVAAVATLCGQVVRGLLRGNWATAIE